MRAALSGVRPVGRGVPLSDLWGRGVSARALAHVLEHSPYKGTKLLCHVVIADCVNDLHGNEFWMRTSELARRARCSRASACRALAEMVEDGGLELLESGATAGQASRYRFVEKPVDNTTELSDRVPHHEAGGCLTMRQGVPHHEAHNLKGNLKSKKDIAQAAFYDLGFERFWSRYPRKLGKRKAFLTWVKLEGSHDAIEAGLGPWIDYWERRAEPEFIPHPTTWLSRQDWESEPPPPPSDTALAAPVTVDGTRRFLAGTGWIDEARTGESK